jgi:hypothetical protein
VETPDQTKYPNSYQKTKLRRLRATLVSNAGNFLCLDPSASLAKISKRPLKKKSPTYTR